MAARCESEAGVLIALLCDLARDRAIRHAGGAVQASALCAGQRGDAIVTRIEHRMRGRAGIALEDLIALMPQEDGAARGFLRAVGQALALNVHDGLTLKTFADAVQAADALAIDRAFAGADGETRKSFAGSDRARRCAWPHARLRRPARAALR